MQRAEEQAEAQKEMRQQTAGSPFRFYCPVGETREVVVVDDEPDFFRYEHNLKNPRSGRYDVYCACIAEHANCPVDTATDRPAYFGMFLTIIDLTPYENKDGIEVPWSKKLLVIKQQQQKKIVRMLDRLKAQRLTLRGAILQMTRDSDKDSAIGNEIEYMEHMSEEDMLTYESEYTDQNGKVHPVIGHEMFDYDAIFPMPTEQMLRSIVGGRAGPGTTDGDEAATGSRRVTSSRRAPARDNWEGEQRGAAPPVRRTARSAQPALDPDDNPEAGVDDLQPGDEGYEEEQQPPQRSSRAAPTRPLPSRAATQAPSRAAAPVQSRAAPAARTRPEPVDLPPARTSLANRRQQLRR
jgi:hypothetical protein